MKEKNLILEKKWSDIANRQLLGRRIMGVRYMSEEERADYGWSHRPIVITLDDGNFFFPAADAEGNSAGVFFTADEHEAIIPNI